jgi:ABC-type transport system involved in multi-copper enzyme maturation permease subunit
VTWLAWRQFRAQAWVGIAVVAALALVFGITGVQLHNLADDSGYPGCITAGLCHNFISSVNANGLYSVLYPAGTILIYVAPALIAIFWGAPLLARDLETGSYRLLWTQSISRTQWLTVKLLLVGAAAMITAGVLSLIVTWWSAPIDAVGGPHMGAFRLDPLQFGARGIAPIGYAAFAFTLAATIGLLTRRTLPAMAIAFAVFLAIQIITPLWIRPHLHAPVTTTIAITSPNINIEITNNQVRALAQDPPLAAWILSDDNVDSTGSITVIRATDACMQSSPEACTAYVLGLHVSEKLTYQPADRFWPFQAYETGAFVLASLALAGFGNWRVKRLN